MRFIGLDGLNDIAIFVVHKGDLVIFCVDGADAAVDPVVKMTRGVQIVLDGKGDTARRIILSSHTHETVSRRQGTVNDHENPRVFVTTGTRERGRPESPDRRTPPA